MKKFIKNTVNSIRTNAIRLAATRRSGEGYIDTAVKILIAASGFLLGFPRGGVGLVLSLLLVCVMGTTAFAAGTGDVAGAVESTWQTASGQIKTVVNNVVFPAIDLILAVVFFAKLGTAYFDFRKSGQFEWTAPAILFACLVFTLTAPLYIWQIIGI